MLSLEYAPVTASFPENPEIREICVIRDSDKVVGSLESPYAETKFVLVLLFSLCEESNFERSFIA